MHRPYRVADLLHYLNLRNCPLSAVRVQGHAFLIPAWWLANKYVRRQYVNMSSEFGKFLPLPEGRDNPDPRPEVGLALATTPPSPSLHFATRRQQ
jgi:hypothetical protein